jgi:drug/metabolite transporter (DMT)-like permease
VSDQAPDPDSGRGSVHAELETVEMDGTAFAPVLARPGIFELAWPSITTNILQSIVGIVDMAIVGRVSVDAQAAVGSGHRIFFIGQAFMIAALHHASPSLLAPIGYSQLLWATIFGFILFGNLPDGWTVAGAGIIVLSGLYMWWREQKVAR